MRRTNHPHALFAMATVVLIATSCSIYHPQAVDIPLLEEQGELRADVAVGLSTWIIVPDNFSLSGTASYAFTDNIAGQLHASTNSSGYYLQAAPGFFTTVGEKGIVEAYVGFGMGSAESQNQGNTSAADTAGQTYAYGGHFMLPFVQVNAGWRHLGPVELAVGIKAGSFLPRYTYNEYTLPDLENATYSESYRTTNMLIEPQLQFRIGGEHVKFTLRISYAYLSHLHDFGGTHLNYDRFTISNGLMFNF